MGLFLSNFIYHKKGWTIYMEDILHVGLDVGSTTVKIIVMDDNKNTIYKD